MTTTDARDESTSGTHADHAARHDGTSALALGPTLVIRLVASLILACAVLAGCPAIERFTAHTAIGLPQLSDAWTEGAGGSLGAGKAPPHERVDLGRSVNGVPLTMDLFGDGPDAVLVVGGIHGDEPTGAEAASELAALLRGNPELLIGSTVGIVARANPDGLSSGTRANAHGVDLNRNFPSRAWRRARAGELHHGTHPASEPETLAIMAAIEVLRPSRVIDIHSINHGRHCNNYDGPAEHLARRMSRLNGYPVLPDVGYPTPGALGCWTGIDLGIPAVTLELPRELSAEKCWRDNAAALLAFINAGDDRHARLQAGSQ